MYFFVKLIFFKMRDIVTLHSFYCIFSFFYTLTDLLLFKFYPVFSRPVKQYRRYVPASNTFNTLLISHMVYQSQWTCKQFVDLDEIKVETVNTPVLKISPDIKEFLLHLWPKYFG